MELKLAFAASSSSFAVAAAAVILRTCNGAEYQVKILLSMPIYAFHGAILGGISAGGYAVYCYLNGVHNYLHR